MAVYTIKATGGDYSTLTAWEAAAPATLTEPYEAECYDFACDDDVAVVGVTTSPTNYLRIYAAASAALDGRSRDVSGRGFQLFRSSGATAGVLRVDADYLRVEGIEFTNKGTTGYTLSIVATRTAGANDVRVSGCIIHDVRTGTQYTCSITASNLNLTLTNNIIYGYQRSWDTRGAASVVSNNNTIWRHADQIGVVSQTELVCKNTYSGRVSGTSECFWTGGSSPSGNNNASSDNSAATDYTSSLTTVAGAVIFQSVTPGAEDFRLVTGAALIDAGVTLTVANDIAGTTRPSGSAWDIGAWEFVSASTGTIYDDDVSFGLSLGIDPQASRVLNATATFAAVLAASTSNQAVLAGDVTLGILAGVTAGAALIAEAAVTLGMEAALSQAAQADLNAAVAFATTLAATGGPNLTLETAVTLASEAGIGSSGKITAEAAAQFAITLAQAASAPISSNIYEEAISLGMSMLVASAADRVIDRAIEFGVGFGAQISASLDAAAHASFTMAFAAGVGAALEIVQSAHLDIAFSQEASGNLIVEGSVTLPIEVAARYTANGILGAQVEFRAQFDQRSSAILTADEAVILATKFAAEAVATTGQLPPRIIELHGQTESGMTLRGTMRLTVNLQGKVN